MMIMKELNRRTDYRQTPSAEMQKFLANTQATYTRIKRLDAMKAFKVESMKLRAKIARKWIEHK